MGGGAAGELRHPLVVRTVSRGTAGTKGSIPPGKLGVRCLVGGGGRQGTRGGARWRRVISAWPRWRAAAPPGRGHVSGRRGTRRGRGGRLSGRSGTRRRAGPRRDLR